MSRSCASVNRLRTQRYKKVSSKAIAIVFCRSVYSCSAPPRLRAFQRKVPCHCKSSALRRLYARKKSWLKRKRERKRQEWGGWANSGRHLFFFLKEMTDILKGTTRAWRQHPTQHTSSWQVFFRGAEKSTKAVESQVEENQKKKTKRKKERKKSPRCHYCIPPKSSRR